MSTLHPKEEIELYREIRDLKAQRDKLLGACIEAIRVIDGNRAMNSREIIVAAITHATKGRN